MIAAILKEIARLESAIPIIRSRYSKEDIVYTRQVAQIRRNKDKIETLKWVLKQQDTETMEKPLSHKKQLKLSIRQALAEYHNATGDTIDSMSLEGVEITTKDDTDATAKDISIGYFKVHTSF